MRKAIHDGSLQYWTEYVFWSILWEKNLDDIGYQLGRYVDLAEILCFHEKIEIQSREDADERFGGNIDLIGVDKFQFVRPDSVPEKSSDKTLLPDDEFLFQFLD
jgi:hypothetical protein